MSGKAKGSLLPQSEGRRSVDRAPRGHARSFKSLSPNQESKRATCIVTRMRDGYLGTRRKLIPFPFANIRLDQMNKEAFRASCPWTRTDTLEKRS